jgi:hypothetical protein
MNVNLNTWSNSEEKPLRWQCPSCGAGVPAEALAGGQKLVRCRQCSQMLRRVITPTWPIHPSAAYESAPHPNDAGYIRPEFTPQERLEPAPSYPYPTLQCPYCEYINHASPPIRLSGQQYCANCGADLKKNCLNCDASLYVLDNYCTRCRSDQEQLKYEIEAYYWQIYNEGKRLAQLGRWRDAERELSLFFNPRPEIDQADARRARQIYTRSIAPTDNSEGLQLYNEARAQLRHAYEARQRRLQHRKWVWAGLSGIAVLMLGLFSASTFGAWWVIFIIVPVIGLLVIFLIFLLLSSLGLC